MNMEINPTQNAPSQASPGSKLLSVRNLQTWFYLDDKRIIKAVDDVSFDLNAGETLGIVGESGSGKSTVMVSIIRVVDQPGRIVGGNIFYKGQDLLKLSNEEMRRLQGKNIGIVFQDPTASLNPLFTIGQQLREAVKIHEDLSKQGIDDRVHDILQKVGIEANKVNLNKYPCDFSPGYRQRVMIALAILCRPDLIMADEPTTILGVTVQAWILESLRQLQQELGAALIMVTHDFGVVTQMASKIMVMYAGHLVELANRNDILLSPRHPYTLGLIRSVPIIEARRSRRLTVIPGFSPDMINLPPGCPFAPRCERALKECSFSRPPLSEVAPNHQVACFNPIGIGEVDILSELEA